MRPSYVEVKLAQGRNTSWVASEGEPPVLLLGTVKLVSYSKVALRSPAGMMSFRLRVYTLPSATATETSRPSQAVKFQSSDPTVCCEAKPAPPKVVMSRYPANVASFLVVSISRYVTRAIRA